MAIILLLAIAGILIYLNTYYHADREAVDAFLEQSQVETVEIDSGIVAFVPRMANAGFIFYPGGKVEAEAYYPLMAECAKNGVLSVIVEMPFNLAVFNINGADGIKEEFPEVENWYVGGHSLGGSMAATYLDNHREDYEGLILLGSYSTIDFRDSDIRALSIYGENDRVMNREKYDECKANLSTLSEHEIVGGNHAGFGMYGRQDGDGIALITSEEQIKKAASIIIEFVE
ncbi:MAG: hypothetical protein E7602_03340 [Ruminococcaceae bacterium]|nr:hypothetical protein [Oscillospiraceae bacterium]